MELLFPDRKTAYFEALRGVYLMMESLRAGQRSDEIPLLQAISRGRTLLTLCKHVAEGDEAQALGFCIQDMEQARDYLSLGRTAEALATARDTLRPFAEKASLPGT